MIQPTNHGMKITYQPIGVIHSPFTQIEGMPIQPAGGRGIQGKVEIFPEFQAGLSDLGGFSHIILLYHLHRARGYRLTVTPFLDDRSRGVFATRAPKRPNPIGLSVVRLVKREENILYIENVDVLDGTPLLDIKPHIPDFEPDADIRVGWLEDTKGEVQDKRSDGRFR